MAIAPGHTHNLVGLSIGLHSPHCTDKSNNARQLLDLDFYAKDPCDVGQWSSMKIVECRESVSKLDLLKRKRFRYSFVYLTCTLWLRDYGSEHAPSGNDGPSGSNIGALLRGPL